MTTSKDKYTHRALLLLVRYSVPTPYSCRLSYSMPYLVRYCGNSRIDSEGYWKIKTDRLKLWGLKTKVRS